MCKVFYKIVKVGFPALNSTHYCYWREREGAIFALNRSWHIISTFYYILSSFSSWILINGDEKKRLLARDKLPLFDFAITPLCAKEKAMCKKRTGKWLRNTQRHGWNDCPNYESSVSRYGCDVITSCYISLLHLIMRQERKDHGQMIGAIDAPLYDMFKNICGELSWVCTPMV